MQNRNEMYRAWVAEELDKLAEKSYEPEEAREVVRLALEELASSPRWFDCNDQLNPDREAFVHAMTNAKERFIMTTTGRRMVAA